MQKEIEEIEEIEIMTTEEDMNEKDTANNVNNNKEESRDFYVYKHIRKDNNTCFYVGKGKGNRIYVPKRNKHHDRIAKRYGYYVVKVKENLTEKEAYALEKEIIEDYVFVFGYGIDIDGYDDYDHDLPHLTNMNWGGIGGNSGINPYANKTSEEMEIISNKKSNSMKGKNSYANKTPEEIEIISNKKSNSLKGKNKGKKHSEEHNNKISNSMKGKNKGKNAYANKTEEEMRIIGRKISEKVSGEKSGMWGKNPYANKTEEEMEIISNKKSNSMKGKNAGEKNGMWGKPSPNRSKVICITTGKTFNSVTKASNHYKVARSGISNCCKGKCKHAGELQDGTKLQWKYLEDYNNDFKGILINSNN